MIYNRLRGCVKQSIAVIIAGFLLVGCISSTHPSPPASEDKLSEIRARGTLIIATDAGYLPQSRLLPGVLPDPHTKCEPSQYTANQFTGFDVEVAVQIAHALGVEACFVTPPWNQLVAGNWGDQWDIHVGSVAITPERLQSLYFSQPYYATPVVVLLHREDAVIQAHEDLSNKRIGVCASCTFEAYLQSTLQLPGETIEYHVQNAEIIAYENEDPAIDDLSLGDGDRLDAVITILPKARLSIATGRPLKIMDEPLWVEYSSVTLDRSGTRDPARLLDEVTRIIQRLHCSGALKELSLKYHGLDLTREASQFNLLSLQQTP